MGIYWSNGYLLPQQWVSNSGHLLVCTAMGTYSPLLTDQRIHYISTHSLTCSSHNSTDYKALLRELVRHTPLTAPLSSTHSLMLNMKQHSYSLTAVVTMC